MVESECGITLEYMMSTPLWKLLIKIKDFETNEALSCSECFAVLELLAEAARMGIDLDRLEQLAREHIAKCPECQDQFKKRLDQLEAMAN